MFNRLIPIALAASALAAPFTASAVGVYPDFTVSTTSIPGATAVLRGLSLIDDTFVADKLTGNYSEIVTVKNDGTFASRTIATFTAFTYNSASPATTGSTGMNSTYVLYAELFATGTYSAAGFTGTAATITLNLDAGFGNVATRTSFAFGADASAAVTWSNNADDYKLGSAPGLAKPGQVDLIIPAAFDFHFKDFNLTSTDQDAVNTGNQSGKTFFVAPADFYVNVHSDGDINAQSVATLNGAIAEALNPLGTGKATRTLAGELSADFSRPVPEPAGLALVGLALAAVGLTTRRRKQA